MATAVKESKKWFRIKNLSNGSVSCQHPDRHEGERPEFSVPWRGEIAIDAALWSDVPDLKRLERLGLITITESDTRDVAKMAELPPQFYDLSAAERSSAEQIAFNPDDEMIGGIINLLPELETPNRLQRNPRLNIEYLQTRHLRILEAAAWLAENNPVLPFTEARKAHVAERIEFIRELS